MTLTKIWLDDERPPPDESWKVAKYIGMALYLAQTAKGPVHISFDHDLGEHSLDGYYLAKEFERKAHCGSFLVESWEIHSQNPVGARNIRAAMESYDKLRYKNNKQH